MTRETKIALLVGLVFIICFGVILGNAHTDRVPAPRPGGTLAVNPSPALNARSGGLEHSPVPPLPDTHTAGSTTPSPAPAGQTAPGGGVLSTVQGTGAMVGTGNFTPVTVPPTPDPEPVAQNTTTATTPPAPPTRTETTPPAAPKQMHKVAERDTLYTIAGRYYGRGNESNYKLILEANKATLPSAEKLQVGQELIIPPLPGATRVVDGRALNDYLRTLPGGSTPTNTAVSPSRTVAPSTPVPSGTARGTTGGTPVGTTSVTVPVNASTPVIGRSTTPAPTPAPAPASTLTRLAGNTAPSTTFRTGGLVRLDAPATRPSTTVEARTPAAPAAAVRGSGKTYTVKPHDCLASIARAQMKDGSGAAVNKLFAANRDKLSSPEKLSPGMVLVIPN